MSDYVQVIKVRAGDTEPLAINIDATGLSNLDTLSTAVLYARKTGDAANHVDGVALTVKDSALQELWFDPVGAKSGGGNAFDAEGVYLCYVKATWTDADETRHPGGRAMIQVEVTEVYE